jgi:hypothetical protein
LYSQHGQKVVEDRVGGEVLAGEIDAFCPFFSELGR